MGSGEVASCVCGLVQLVLLVTDHMVWLPYTAW